MNLPARFLDELRERLTLSDIVGQQVKLTRKGREFTGLCPFHHEKTPSFTVNDDKGFYHCFGCGAHGDAIKFLMDHDKLPFMEAIESLARRAGLTVPQTPQDKKADEERRSASVLMEHACQFFERHLFSAVGDNARTYLKKRGLTGAVAKRFRLGYAPSGSGLTAFFQSKGFDLSAARRLGLIAYNESRRQFHDYFYDRVMFPIINRRGQVIGFGGRLMAAGEPKYLNSPETELFHKGEQLYALNQAIDTIRRKNSAVVVEGYMDVIALHTAGFTNAVAPLGTAFTENQLKLLWHGCDEPIICFDGDMAGRKAGVRALYRALPILTAGKSLRFALLPDTFDPDDMIRKKSPLALEKVLSTALPMNDMLWNTLLENRALDTPERLAKFEKDCADTLEKIQNESVRSYYKKDFKNRLWHLQHPQKSGRPVAFERQKLPTVVPFLDAARMLLAYAFCWPQVIQDFADDIAAIHLPDHPLTQALEQILTVCAQYPDATPEMIQENIPFQLADMIPAELEMLRKSDRMAADVKLELKELIRAHHIRLIQSEIDAKTKECLATGDSRLWQEVLDLKKEIEKRTA